MPIARRRRLGAILPTARRALGIATPKQGLVRWPGPFPHANPPAQIPPPAYGNPPALQPYSGPRRQQQPPRRRARQSALLARLPSKAPLADQRLTQHIINMVAEMRNTSKGSPPHQVGATLADVGTPPLADAGVAAQSTTRRASIWSSPPVFAATGHASSAAADDRRPSAAAAAARDVTWTYHLGTKPGGARTPARVRFCSFGSTAASGGNGSTGGWHGAAAMRAHCHADAPWTTPSILRTPGLRPGLASMIQAEMERSFKRELRAGLSSPITARSCVFQDGSRAACGASRSVTSANDGADDSAGAASWASPLPVASAASAASAAFSAAAASFSVAASGGNAAQVHAFDVLQAAVATPAARGLAARLNDVMGFPTWAQQLGGRVSSGSAGALKSGPHSPYSQSGPSLAAVGTSPRSSARSSVGLAFTSQMIGAHGEGDRPPWLSLIDPGTQPRPARGPTPTPLPIPVLRPSRIPCRLRRAVLSVGLTAPGHF